VFDQVLRIVEKQGLLKGKVVGVDSTYLRADASMKTIVRRDTAEGYQQYLRRLAKESGIKEPTAEDLRRMDRKRQGKRTSNKDWQSPVDPDSRVARLKDGRTRLAHKAEHVVDMESGAIAHADILDATSGDASTITDSLDAADARLSRVREKNDDDHDDTPPAGGSSDAPSTAKHIKEVCGDKGYHKAKTLRDIERRGIRSYIPERKQSGKRRFTDKGGYLTCLAFHKNRARVRRAKGKALQRRRGELIERTFAHICETGGHRRVRLRGRDNIRKRYLIQTAAFNLAVVMRKIIGVGTPRGFADAKKGLVSVLLVLWGLMRSLSTVYNRRLSWVTHYASPCPMRDFTLPMTTAAPALHARSTGC
jgi:Transposase DDE domain